MLTLALGMIIGAVAVLVWNYVNPNKVAKFTAKYKSQIEAELAKLPKT